MQAPEVDQVRSQIKDMIAPGDAKQFAESLPDSTASTGEVETKKRTRRTKAEMDAERGGSKPTEPVIDPLMADARYAKIMGRMSGAGGKKIIGFAFKASGKPLNGEEEQELDDQFYVMAKRGGWNPGQSWFAILLYFFLAVLGPMVAERTEIGEKIAELFRPLPQAPKKDAKGAVVIPEVPETQSTVERIFGA